MTAVEEYKRHRSDMKVANMVSGTRTEYLADAALAELEAENEAMRGTITHQTNIINRGFGYNYDRAEQAEAERDSMYQACKDAGWEVESGNPEKFVAELAALKEEGRGNLHDRIDELEVLIDGANERGSLLLASKNNWADRARQAEAKLAEVTEDRNGFREAFNKCIERAEDAEDEVKELKGQRCEGCRHIGGCYIFDRAVNHTKPYFGNFACNRWAERGAKP